jgi:hypothetical protein
MAKAEITTLESLEKRLARFEKRTDLRLRSIHGNDEMLWLYIRAIESLLKINTASKVAQLVAEAELKRKTGAVE